MDKIKELEDRVATLEITVRKLTILLEAMVKVNGSQNEAIQNLVELER